MAEFPGINRRRLLASAAVITAAGITPKIEGEALTKTENALALQEPMVLCEANARRCAEIVRRNHFRREAGLPLLQIIPELRRMKQLDDLHDFERFEAANRPAVLQEVLQSYRETTGRQNWRPNWVEGMYLNNRVREILLQRFGSGRDAVL